MLEIFGTRLKELTQNENIKKLCAKIGVSTKTLEKWRNGESLPSVRKATELAEQLNCNMDYLLGLSDRP